ncbi:MAG: hypothetical protein DRI86_01545 [Bacteroidetes bacterium]|nr:MAG: hypothetical protein DRI86_01545 [Bacteroidota bacterium]
MKNKLLLLTVLLFAFVSTNAQYSVLLVDDDANGYDEWSYVQTALINSGYSYDTINIDTVAPDFATMNNFDMVIWHTANDGLDLHLWDTTATVQFNPALKQYIDAGGVVWVDGLDFMYAKYGSAPVDFAAGDFVYDYMGVSKYACQSHADDTVGTYVGLTLALPTASNTITTIDSIQWKWSALWYGDGFEITTDATSLFEMGPADYDFAGMVNGLYKENVITTSLRIASLGDGSARVQADIDLVVKEMIVAAEAGTFAKNTPPAGYSVLLVDDDANGYDEWSYVQTALINSGYSYDTLNIDTVAPDFATLNNFDMVIWHTANDGQDLYLWDTTATVQYNEALREYIDSNGVVWVDGLDFMYNMYGSAPVDFADGDFVYDVMGISKYACQSHADDTVGTYVGLTLALPAATNTITTIDSIQWKWSALWYGDGFEITNKAIALFEMGPDDYDFAGMVNGLYKENVITTSLRIASLGDGSTRVQADIDLLVKEMIVAAEAGTFVKDNTSITYAKEEQNIVLYPNPASDEITITFESAKNASIRVFDLTGKIVLTDVIDENSTKYRFNVSDFNSGMYFYQITIDNKAYSSKFVVVK